MTTRVQKIMNLSIFLLAAAMLMGLGSILNQASTVRGMEKNYLINKLESLNKAKTPVERALFKEFESCIESHRWSMALTRATYSGFWVVFEEAFAETSFNQQAEACLNTMSYNATYQKESLSDIAKVKEVISKFETIKLIGVK